MSGDNQLPPNLCGVLFNSSRFSLTTAKIPSFAWGDPAFRKKILLIENPTKVINLMENKRAINNLFGLQWMQWINNIYG